MNVDQRDQVVARYSLSRPGPCVRPQDTDDGGTQETMSDEEERTSSSTASWSEVSHHEIHNSDGTPGEEGGGGEDHEEEQERHPPISRRQPRRRRVASPATVAAIARFSRTTHFWWESERSCEGGCEKPLGCIDQDQKQAMAMRLRNHLSCAPCYAATTFRKGFIAQSQRETTRAISSTAPAATATEVPPSVQAENIQPAVTPTVTQSKNQLHLHAYFDDCV
jgi:hypothetical protein